MKLKNKMLIILIIVISLITFITITNNWNAVFDAIQKFVSFVLFTAISIIVGASAMFLFKKIRGK